MTVRDALSSSGSERADSEILLSFVLQKPRTWLIAHMNEDIDQEAADRFFALTERRQRGEPVAYMTGIKSFYGREFVVSPAVLIPRPATEILVEQALRVLAGESVERVLHIDRGIVAWTEMWKSETPSTVVDVGTGSGCIAITIACERPDLHIIATDISQEALAIARKNAKLSGVSERIRFVQGRGLEPLADLTEPFLLVSNPPYIPADEELMRDVADFEPHLALFAGKEGRDIVDELHVAAKNHPSCVGFVMECREEQIRSSRPT